MVKESRLKPAIEIPETRRFRTGFYNLDEALGGGIVIGSITEIFGDESDGKTTLGIQLLSKAQKEGFKVLYIDAEHSVIKEYLERFVDLSNLFFIKPASAEEAFSVIREFYDEFSDVDNMIFIDSVPALSPERYVQTGDVKIAELALLLSQNLPVILRKYYNSLVVFTNQIRKKINVGWGGGSGEDTAGGKALKFYAGYRLELNTSKIIIDENKNQIGKNVSIKIVKNKFSKPFGHCSLELYFGQGYSHLSDLFDFCVKYKIIQVSGSWYKYNDLTYQGRNTFIKAIKEDKDLFVMLKEEAEKILNG